MTDLSLTYTNLLAEAGYMLAFGETTGSYTTDQTSRADKAVQEGLRLFYYPDVQGVPFTNWSFMRAVANLSVVASTSTYDMPVGFDTFEGDITFASGSGYPPITIISEDAIRSMLWPSSSSGWPSYGAVRPKNTTLDSTAVQTLELLLFPTPSITATATYRYRIKPQILESGVLYPLGSAAHTSTIRAAVKAAAELAENDERGIHWDTFKERLRASIRIDGQSAPESLGKCVDTSYLQTAWGAD